MWRISSLCLLLGALAASALLPVVMAAQSQGAQSQEPDPVVEAARKAREQKKKAGKPATVITDETLQPGPGSTNPPDLQNAKAWQPTVPGQTSAAEADSSAKASQSTSADQPATATAESTDEAAAVQKADQNKEDRKAEQKEEAKRLAEEVAKAKEKLTQVQNELDLLQREFSLDRETLYSNPGYAGDSAGKSKLDALQQQITGKQQDVSNAKTRLAELQEQLAKLAPAESAAPASPQP